MLSTAPGMICCRGRWPLRLAMFGFAVAAISGRPAYAQQIRGMVRDGASQQPLSIAAVLALDAHDSVLARTLSDGHGAFVLPVAAGAELRLRVLRIGYRPVTLPLAVDGQPVEIALSRLSTSLDPIPVVIDRQCPDNADVRRAMALWERARSALMTAIVARESKSATMGGVLYERIYRRYNGHRDGEWRLDQVFWQSGSTPTWQGTGAFRSDTSASFLESSGYASPDFAGRWPVLHYPDEAILFDDSFVRTHCFKPAASSDDHRGETGVAFQPTRARTNLTDIEGAVWLDTASFALRSVEFMYTHPPYDHSQFEESTGSLSFATAVNGIPLLVHWRIRRPPNFSLTRGGSTAGVIRPGDPVLGRLPGLVAAKFPEPMQEDGGELAFARWDDGVEWMGTLPVLSGQVRDLRTKRPAAAALVSLVNAGITVRTDSAGNFRFPYVASGPAIIDVVDTAYSFLHRSDEDATARFSGIKAGPDYGNIGLIWTAVYGMGIPRGTLHDNQASIVIDPERNDAVTVDINSGERLLRDVCGDRLKPDTLGVLAGQVWRGPAPVGSVLVSATWRTGSTEVARSTVTDERGMFFICGVPRQRAVTVAAIRGADTTGVQVTTAGQLVTTATIRMP